MICYKSYRQQALRAYCPNIYKLCLGEVNWWLVRCAPGSNWFLVAREICSPSSPPNRSAMHKQDKLHAAKGQIISKAK